MAELKIIVIFNEFEDFGLAFYENLQNMKIFGEF
jgi:hypothetical protein